MSVVENSAPAPATLKAIESFIDRLGQFTAWIALVMISLVAINVVLRYSMSFGSVWAQELEWHLLAALILLGMCYALQRGDNVRVDLFYANYSATAKYAVDVISAVLTIVASLLFIYLSLTYIEQAYSISEGSADPGGIPYRWVLKAMIPLGYGLLALQQVGHVIRLVVTRRASLENARV